MDWFRLIALCILASAMTMILTQMHPRIAALLGVAFGAMLLSAMLPAVGALLGEMLAFFDSAAIDGQYARVMLKAMGIVLVTRLAQEACVQMDAPFIARRAEFCGRIALLGVCVPVFLELTRMAVDVLQ